MENHPSLSHYPEHPSLDPLLEEWAIFDEAVNTDLPIGGIGKLHMYSHNLWSQLETGLAEGEEWAKDVRPYAVLAYEQEQRKERVSQGEDGASSMDIQELQRMLAVDRVLRSNGAKKLIPDTLIKPSERYDYALGVAVSDPSRLDTALDVYMQSENVLMEVEACSPAKVRRSIRHEIVGTAMETLGFKRDSGDTTTSFMAVLARSKSEELWERYVQGDVVDVSAEHVFASRVVLECLENIQPTAETLTGAMNFLRAQHPPINRGGDLRGAAAELRLIDEAAALLRGHLPKHPQNPSLFRENDQVLLDLRDQQKMAVHEAERNRYANRAVA